MKINYKLFLFIFFIAIFISCTNSKKDQNSNPVFSSFYDIPGITVEEINAIEELQKKYDYFVYGMPLSTEAFENRNGSIDGFAVLFCDWLTELFGIPFRLKLYDWQELFAGLETMDISFTSELTPTQERRKIYYMTGDLVSRSVKRYRIAGSKPLPEITAERPLRCGFITGSTIGAVTADWEDDTYELVWINEYNQVYDALKNGEIDVFYYSGAMEITFIDNNDVVAEDFFPLIRMPVSLMTMNPELKPVISAMEKTLSGNASDYLVELYNQGYQNYRKHKLFAHFTPEEISYIASNPVIPYSAEYDNYPACFYNVYLNEWSGIFLDVLNEIEFLTGLNFKLEHNQYAELSDLLPMLEKGETFLHCELIRTADNENNFIWPATMVKTDIPVLISKMEHRFINIHEIYSQKVGLSKGTAYTELFNRWFPNHSNTTEYENQTESFNALTRGEIDMVMNSYSGLLHLTHYQGLTGYKINFMFDYSYNSTFGVNRNETVLCSIINKALEMIDTGMISEHWMRRTYDYRIKLIETQLPWFIGTTILFLGVLVLIFFLFVKSRQEGKELEKLVGERTQELALQTATFTTLFDSIPDLIFTKNIELNFVHCNKAFLEHFNKGINDVVGYTGGNEMGITGEEVESYSKIDRKVINERQTVKIEEYIPRYDGTKLYYETIKMPLVLDNDVIGIMGISRDITARKEIERQMAARYEYSKKLSNALTKITKSETITAGILRDAADVISSVGCGALNVHRLGIWSFTEGKTVLESISYYDSFTGKNSIQEGMDLTKKNEYVKLLKSERLIVMNNIDDCRLISTSFDGYYDSLCAALDAPIRVDGKMVGLVCVEQGCCKEYPDKREWLIEEQNFASSLADLMALAISGEERRKAREAAETASQTKSSFLANMSHEIRTPMNAILGITEILIQNEKLSSDIEEGLGKIYSSCTLLLGIINDILDFSKIEAGKLDIMPAQYKVASMINDSVHLNMMRIESKPIKFELQIDDNIPAVLTGDELRIKQILNNLLSNAFKYTDSGKVTLSVQSEKIPLVNYLPDHSMSGRVQWSDPDKEGIFLVFSIKDTGHGMTREQLSKMFEEYSRFNPDRNTTVEGTGLGLAITKRLLNLMDGDMHVESTPNVGTFFKIRLPQGIVDSSFLDKEVIEHLRQFHINYITKGKRGQIVRDPMPYGSVLIVDDVETNLYVAIGLMKLYRLQIDTAMSGQIVIDKIRNGNTYDVIFMDHMMPEMDGIETTRHLRNLNYMSPIVALTANAVSGQADMFMQNGFDDFISKPIDIRQLNYILNKFIRDKQPADVIEAARMEMSERNEESNIQPQTDSILLNSFIRDAKKAVSWLEEQFLQADNKSNNFEDEDILQRFIIIIHGIKSSLWNIGETTLSESANDLERNGREHNIGNITAETPSFLNSLRALLEKLQVKQVTENAVDENTEELRNKMLLIKKKAAEYDRKGVLDIISGIRNYSENTKIVLDKLTENVIHSNFEEAGIEAASYAAALE
ncbi:MAG: transporter substrate-binding domain-containing protein [Treponema sp.]|nr:transporter substrate-binding domain-containing protein [Treponema sp.]